MSAKEDNLDEIQGAEDLDFQNASYTDFNPLEEAVKERSYTKANIDASSISGELEEPVFEAPSFEDYDEAPNQSGGGGEDPGFANPSLNNLDNKEKRYATEQMVDTVLDGYERLTSLGNNLVQVKESKIKKMYAEGEINPGIQIPIDGAGNTVSVEEFVQEFNSQTSEAIKTTPEFKETVRPAMVRVFEKRGIGMTDEQFLLYHFGVDLATKSITIFALRRQMSSIFDMLREMSGTMPSPEPKPKAKSRPAPEPEYEPEPVNARENQIVNGPDEDVDVRVKIKSTDPFRRGVPSFEGDPTFGDPDILNQLQKLSEESPRPKKEPRKGAGRPGRPRKQKLE
jgi:hypothetical protein